VIRSIEPSTGQPRTILADLSVCGLGFFAFRSTGYGGIDSTERIYLEMLHRAHAPSLPRARRILATLITRFTTKDWSPIESARRASERSFSSAGCASDPLGVPTFHPRRAETESIPSVYPAARLGRSERLRRLPTVVIRLITLAPEIDGSLPFLRRR